MDSKRQWVVQMIPTQMLLVCSKLSICHWLWFPLLKSNKQITIPGNIITGGHDFSLEARCLIASIVLFLDPLCSLSTKTVCKARPIEPIKGICAIVAFPTKHGSSWWKYENFRKLHDRETTTLLPNFCDLRRILGRFFDLLVSLSLGPTNNPKWATPVALRIFWVNKENKSRT